MLELITAPLTVTMSRRKSLLTAAARDGVLGRVVTVRGDMVVNTMPLPPAKLNALMRAMKDLSGDYARYDLPLRMAYFEFGKTFFLGVMARFSSVFVWAEIGANVTELEAIAKKVAATAHLKSGGVEEPIWDFVRGAVGAPNQATLSPTISSPTDTPNPPSIMNWKDATKALESILTKVLAQAQASKLIDKAMADHGVTMEDSFEIDDFAAVGRVLMEKIPHKVLRNSLSKEFESFLAKNK
jgi:hypothetical protein